MPYCPSCGIEIENDWKHCPNCGYDQINFSEQENLPKPIQSPFDDNNQYKISADQSIATPQQFTSSEAYDNQPPIGTYSQVSSYRNQSNGFGIAAITCAIIGLCCAGYIFGGIAIVLGAVGMKKDKSSGPGTAGLVLGIIVIICTLISQLLLGSMLMFYL